MADLDEAPASRIMSHLDSQRDSPEAPMSQLTIRGFEPELDRRLRETARREGVSLNQAALRLMRRGAGLAESRGAEGGLGNALDRFFGTWTAAEASEFEAAVSLFEQIDEETWR
jgi:hypothetical protein